MESCSGFATAKRKRCSTFGAGRCYATKCTTIEAIECLPEVAPPATSAFRGAKSRTEKRSHIPHSHT